MKFFYGNFAKICFFPHLPKILWARVLLTFRPKCLPSYSDKIVFVIFFQNVPLNTKNTILIKHLTAFCWKSKNFSISFAQVRKIYFRSFLLNNALDTQNVGLTFLYFDIFFSKIFLWPRRNQFENTSQNFTLKVRKAQIYSFGPCRNHFWENQPKRSSDSEFWQYEFLSLIVLTELGASLLAVYDTYVFLKFPVFSSLRHF